MNAQDLAAIDLEKLEEALDQRDLQGLLEEQLRKVHKIFLDSMAGSTARLDISTESSSSSKKILREGKRRGQKPVHQLIKEAGNLMINSGQIQKLSEGYLHLHPSS
jgi:biotin-(acetyl-CoA carboxylase) ligase